MHTMWKRNVYFFTGRASIVFDAFCTHVDNNIRKIILQIKEKMLNEFILMLPDNHCLNSVKSTLVYKITSTGRHWKGGKQNKANGSLQHVSARSLACKLKISFPQDVFRDKILFMNFAKF